MYNLQDILRYLIIGMSNVKQFNIELVLSSSNYSNYWLLRVDPISQIQPALNHRHHLEWQI